MRLDGADAAGRRQAALDLLARYVRVVDDPGRIGEWPQLFAAESEYLVVTRENQERGLPIAIIRDDCKDRILDRVTIIREFWGADRRAEDRHFNAAWTRHLVGPTWVEPTDDGRVLVGANVMVWAASRLDAEPRLLALGEYQDVVDFSEGAAKFRSKKLILDTPVLQDAFVYHL
jgi:anthranilate 1,2-dioxygenase small subunit